MIHDLPKTTEGDTDEDVLLEWLSEGDIVFSVGKEVELEIISFITSLAPERRPIHKLYIPTRVLQCSPRWCKRKQSSRYSKCDNDD